MWIRMDKGLILVNMVRHTCILQTEYQFVPSAIGNGFVRLTEMLTIASGVDSLKSSHSAVISSDVQGPRRGCAEGTWLGLGMHCRFLRRPLFKFSLLIADCRKKVLLF